MHSPLHLHIRCFRDLENETFTLSPYQRYECGPPLVFEDCVFDNFSFFGDEYDFFFQNKTKIKKHLSIQDFHSSSGLFDSSSSSSRFFMNVLNVSTIEYIDLVSISFESSHPFHLVFDGNDFKNLKYLEVGFE